MQLTGKFIVAALAVASTSATVSAHESSPHFRLLRRAGPTSAAQEMQIQDPTQACTSYGDQGVTQMIQSQKLPQSGQIAKIQPNDEEANKIWQDIQNSGIIPSDVQQKKDTTPPGSAQSNMGTTAKASNYDANADPDCWWTANKCTTPKHKNIPADLSSCSEPSTWGLTFDDGPNCSHNAFYDFLKQQKLKATMFYIGTNVVNWPYQAQRGIVDGHDICVHTWAHRYMTTLTNEQVFAELFYTARAIKAVMGVTPTCWRPPFGDVDDRVRAIATGLGLRTILWEENTNDWEIDEVGVDKIKENYRNIIAKASSGSPIVLSHEINGDTMQIFMDMFPEVQKGFKNIVPISACQNITKPYVEDITYPNFSNFVSDKLNYQGLPTADSIETNPNAMYDSKKAGFVNPSSSSDLSESVKSNDNQESETGDSAKGSTTSQPSAASEKTSSAVSYSSNMVIMLVLGLFVVYTVTL
ncbi:chitin deacetylase [Malassezia pachydermatis]